MNRQRRHNEKGAALIMALFVLVILLALSAVFLLQVVQESRMAWHERELMKSFYIAEGGISHGLITLDELINTDLYDAVSAANPAVVSVRADRYADDGDALGFLMEFAEIDDVPIFTLNEEGTEASYSSLASTALGSGTFDYDIVITAKDDPVVVTVDQWDFPYNYRIESNADNSGLSKTVLLSGDFTVRIQRDNFARYALFTDHHTMPSGSLVWFTDRTNFAGPVHTNQRFSFARNPGSVFDGAVTQLPRESPIMIASLRSPISMSKT